MAIPFKLTGDTNAVRMRQKVEQTIARKIVDVLLAAGFYLSVNNGDEPFEIENSRDRKAIIKAMFLTDDEYLIVSKADNAETDGWVSFVYGNDGWDVMSDYTTNLEPYIGDGTEVQKLIDKYSG